MDTLYSMSVSMSTVNSYTFFGKEQQRINLRLS